MEGLNIKRIAVGVALLYVTLSGAMMLGMAVHSGKHQHTTQHAAQHASFICTWMCSASTFVHSGDLILDEVSRISSNIGFVAVEGFLSRSSVFSFYIRPPPIFPF
jgi:hypothetical protein